MPQSPTSGAVVAREAGGRQLVVLRLGEREYGLATEVVVQVLRMVAIRPVPESPPWIAGVVNLRGRATRWLISECGSACPPGLLELDVAATATVERPGRVEEASTGIPGGPHAVLSVEDNASNVRLVEQILSRQPAVTLTVAMRGLEALDMARNDPPDLVLLDLHLPDLPGEEVLRMLRRDPRTEAVPVVVVSADATPGQAERLRGAGAKEYLTKPLEVRRLLEVLRDNLPAAQAVSRGGP